MSIAKDGFTDEVLEKISETLGGAFRDLLYQKEVMDETTTGETREAYKKVLLDKCYKINLLIGDIWKGGCAWLADFETKLNGVEEKPRTIDLLETCPTNHSGICPPGDCVYQLKA